MKGKFYGITITLTLSKVHFACNTIFTELKFYVNQC